MRKTSKKKKMISLIVPCYNEEEALPIFYKESLKVLKKMDVDYEYILIDDGSRDNTLNEILRLAEKDPNVKYVSFSRNFGKESAMYAGFMNAKGDYAAVMDADMQDPPSLLPEMYEILENGEYDSVATRRADRKGESKVRSWFARKFYQIINKISNTEVVDGARDFRLMKKDMVKAILSMSEYNRFSKGIFGWVGFKTYWLSFENVERVAGTTSWSFWGLFRYAIDGIVNFSNVPLDIASGFGILMTVIAFVMLIFVIVRRLIFGDPVAGWASTMCVIIFIGGIELLCLGIMGQYMGKMYMETKRRPQYIVGKTNIKDEGKRDV